MIGSDSIRVVIGAVLAVLLQFALAPYLAIGGAIPNLVAAFALLLAVTRPATYGAVLPFVLGLVYDLATGGPVGAMAFSLTAFSYLAARMYSSLDNDTLFMPLAVMAAGFLLVELSYAVFLSLFGYNAGFFELIIHRVLPCFVYDLVIGIVLYLFVGRVYKQSSTVQQGIIQLR